MRTQWIYIAISIAITVGLQTGIIVEKLHLIKNPDTMEWEFEIDDNDPDDHISNGHHAYRTEPMIAANCTANSTEVGSHCMEMEAPDEPILAWKIMDLTGRVLQRGGRLMTSEKLNVSLSLPKGIYILETVYRDDKCVQRFSLS